MIVSCPSCATTGDMPAHDGVAHCHACGHSWPLDATREEEAPKADPRRRAERKSNPPIIPGTLESSPASASASGVEDEAAILAREALAAEEARRKRQRALQRERNRWFALAAFCLAIAAVLAFFPDFVARQLPGASRLYLTAGVPVNPAGFEAHGVMATLGRTTDGTAVLTVTGRLVNVTARSRDLPRLRFVLRDARGHALHAWTLKRDASAPAPAGRPLQFATRLANPPEGVKRVDVQILPRS